MIGYRRHFYDATLHIEDFEHSFNTHSMRKTNKNQKTIGKIKSPQYGEELNFCICDIDSSGRCHIHTVLTHDYGIFDIDAD